MPSGGIAPGTITGAQLAAGTITAANLAAGAINTACLLYTSDAADERSSVDLGGRRIIKKTKTHTTQPAAALTLTHNNTTQVQP